MILKLFIGTLAVFSFVYSLREFNNFTIISFEFLSFIFFFSGIIIASVQYFFRKNKIEKRLSIYDFFVPKIFIYGSICSALFFLTNSYFSTDKEYIITSLIYKRYKAYKSSPNSIVAEIKGVEREINIHNYNFEELQEFNNIQINLKNGFWGFQIIQEIKLTK
ncbi:hypothetical protein C8P67_1251 [Flavobacterium aquicola]|uniref:Uncharacterized protein n=2 Tax=Flavobacterium aquicola TaxID=1682742 RepID=A0A3E0DWJ5_9FLAO|nr:hypothetical protein C8P67_1251 [Flavobacterium aquicola]